MTIKMSNNKLREELWVLFQMGLNNCFEKEARFAIEDCINRYQQK